ncbi:Bcl-2 homologous antagonist/killer, partial [Lamprotornis superbus]
GQVAEEAEEVFRSFAFYRYQQEREERGAELPPDPEIEQIQLDLKNLFESDINWGRVIALLAFGYRMAMHVWQSGVGGFLRRIARYLGEFMLQNRIASWIAQQGG